MRFQFRQVSFEQAAGILVESNRLERVGGQGRMHALGGVGDRGLGAMGIRGRGAFPE